MKINRNQEGGVTLAEVVVASTIITVFLSALVGVYNIHMKAIFSNAKHIKASFLAEESVEALKYLRNISWDTYIAPLTTGETYFLVWQNDRWETTSTNIYIDSLYERKLVLEDVERDSDSNIVASDGTLDPNIKKVVATVSWKEGAATTTRDLSTYITNLFDN